MHKEEYFYNALNAAFQSNHKKLYKLRARHTSWEDTWKHSVCPTPVDPSREWRKIERERLSLILKEDTRYPPLLKEIPHAPLGIYVRGTLPPPQNPCIAIVGTRKATSSGKKLAFVFGSELSRAGCTIASGLALGIDVEAHKGCLDAEGIAVAVLGGGLDTIYPRANERVGHEIVKKKGALISEHPLGSETLPHHFLKRNRIISGISSAVLVIEAPERSGALATARFAVEQNRDVYVMPGLATHRNYRGAHELIRRGATLVTKPEHILEDMELSSRQLPLKTHSFSTTPEERAILQALTRAGEGLGVEDIISETKLEASTVNRAVSTLLLRNRIYEEGGRYHI